MTYHIQAYLPCVLLKPGTIINLGPVVFCPFSSTHPFLKENVLISKPLDQMTCLLVRDSNCPLESLVVDSLYLFFFAATFRNLYYDEKIPRFSCFSMIIPLWQGSLFFDVKEEEIVSVEWVDTDLCEGLAKVLNLMYDRVDIPLENQQIASRLIRSIRYFVNRFLEKISLVSGSRLRLPQGIFESEDVLFLAASFEGLFHLNEVHPNQSFKQALRPMLHLKYSRPVEIFWKWVDGFYEIRRNLVLGCNPSDLFFRHNPNFEVPFLHIGIKLFIYAVYYKLFKYHFIESGAPDLYTPPDFIWIHPDELLIFFWPEEIILQKMVVVLKQIKLGNQLAENREALQFLEGLLNKIAQDYQARGLLKDSTYPVRYIPTSKEVLSAYLEQIKSLKKNGPDT